DWSSDVCSSDLKLASGPLCQPVACCWLVTEVPSAGGLSRVPRDGTAREVLASSCGWWRPRVSVRPTADQPSRPGPLQRARIRRAAPREGRPAGRGRDRKSTRLNSSHVKISYAVFCLKKKNLMS